MGGRGPSPPVGGTAADLRSAVGGTVGSSTRFLYAETAGLANVHLNNCLDGL